MVVSLLTSLLLAVTLTPLLAARFTRHSWRPMPSRRTWRPVPLLVDPAFTNTPPAGRCDYCWLALFLSAPLARRRSVAIYSFKLETDFLPKMDEGAFVLDYKMPAGRLSKNLIAFSKSLKGS